MTSECSDTMRCGTRVIWGLVLTFTDHRGRFDVTTGRTSRARAGGHGTPVSGPARHGFGCIPFTTLHNPSHPLPHSSTHHLNLVILRTLACLTRPI
jgi:hypothetical protein